ncbi:MAG: hypothetical protein PHD95_02845 [Candidatus ainarchaeum sp.]|nr:hypothetical protein [Candidatus ainarchaeum sp.]
MNQKGIAPAVIVLAVIVVLGFAWLFVLPAVMDLVNGTCNALEEKYPNGDAWENVCLNPNDQAAKDSLAAFGVNMNSLAQDRNSIAKVSCVKSTSALCPIIPCWQLPSAEITVTCEPGERCVKADSAQEAACEANIAPCNNNGTCDAWEDSSNCPADCLVEGPCNNNGICENGSNDTNDIGENAANCPNDCIEL